ncbi:MAG: hypothetical protein WB785_17110 [Mycobacterium sp.]
MSRIDDRPSGQTSFTTGLGVMMPVQRYPVLVHQVLQQTWWVG